MNERRTFPDLSTTDMRNLIIEADAVIVSHFEQALTAELDAMFTELSVAYQALQLYESSVRPSVRAGRVLESLFGALRYLVGSAQLLVRGFLGPAGNLARSFAESMATALLLSDPRTGELERYEAAPRRYPAHKSIQKMAKRATLRLLDIDSGAWRGILKAAQWYDQLSHASLISLAAVWDGDSGQLSLYPAFDIAKLQVYRAEIELRTQSASVLTEVIEVLSARLSGHSNKGFQADRDPRRR